ncbi:uncharacterized protein [Typha angustifolia]|uniref:uncharacterized protein isoform X1 n=1 Tax=Typha angustifolia TaxID=59011 RepID=UPI003C2DB4C3
MALGKLTIVIGAGIVGSILTKEGHLSDITSIFSGAFRIVTKHLQQEKDSPKSSGKQHTDSLLAQVNNLRQELQLLASSRSVTIVTGTSSGSRTYGVTTVIVVGAVGYVYIRWKGWKLSDMMFATRRGLSDACTTVGKQLEQVSSAIAAVKRHLSSRIDRVDCSLDEYKEIGVATKEEVTLLHGEVTGLDEEMHTVHLAVQSLGTRIDQIQLSQDLSTQGIYELCRFAHKLEQGQNIEAIQASPSSSSPRTIEFSKSMPVTRAGSLPPLALEPLSPSISPSTAAGTPKVLRSSTTISASGLKDLQEISSALRESYSRSNAMRAGASENSNGTPSSNEQSNGTSNSSSSGWKLPSLNILTRTRSAAS